MKNYALTLLAAAFITGLPTDSPAQISSDFSRAQISTTLITVPVIYKRYGKSKLEQNLINSSVLAYARLADEAADRWWATDQRYDVYNCNTYVMMARAYAVRLEASAAAAIVEWDKFNDAGYVRLAQDSMYQAAMVKYYAGLARQIAERGEYRDWTVHLGLQQAIARTWERSSQYIANGY